MKFQSYKPNGKFIYTHFTNATDTRNIEMVFDTIMDIVISENLKKSGIWPLLRVDA